MRPILLLAAAAVAMPAAAQAATDYPVSTQYPVTNLKAIDPSGGLRPCSERYDRVADPAPALDVPVEQAIRDAFNPSQAWALDETMAVVPPPGNAPVDAADEPALRIRFPQNPTRTANGDSPRAGGGFIAPLFAGGTERACLQYKIRFPDTFSFIDGGRLPGLYGGAPTMGRDEGATNGFTLRPAWREDGEGEMVEYIVNGGRDARYGLSVGAARWVWNAGRWITLEQEIVLNTPGQADGIARVWIDGKPMLEQTDIVWRQTAEARVDGVLFSVFFDDLYTNVSTPEEERVYFTDVRAYSGGSADQTAEGEGQ